jgi:deoxyribose-phosphate aldolase
MNSVAARPVFFPSFSATSVDKVALEERAAQLGKRSIKKATKVQGIRLAISMCDLTTLEGKDSPGKIRQMCAKARRPDPEDATVPSVAAVCVYPDLVEIARLALLGSTVKVASVATAFPSGRSPLAVKLSDVRRAVAAGADEIDMVIDRGAFLSGRYGQVFDEIVATKEACQRPDGSSGNLSGAAHLKVILETGELETYDNVRRASDLAIAAGADFIKTSTGKVTPAATPPVTLCMLEAIRDHWLETGVKIGMKPAGGIRTSKQALHYLVIVKETLGADWLTPDLFRFGVSSLLNDLLMQLRKEQTGRYRSDEEFTKD